MAFLNTKDGRTISKNGKGKSLTPKMLSFIDAYFGEANFVAFKAMELSAYKTTTPGSTERTAAELMNHPLVIAEIKRRLDLRTEKTEVKAEWLISKLQTIVNNTQEDNPQAAIRAIELLGKTIAIWKDRQEISGPDGGAFQTEQKVKEDVADFTSRIASLTKRAGENSVVEFPGRKNASGT